MTRLRTMIAAAKHREGMLLGEKKAQTQMLGEVVSKYGLDVRDHKPTAKEKEGLAKIDVETKRLAKVERQYQLASEHRKRLSDLTSKMVVGVKEVNKKLADNAAALKQLEAKLGERRSTYFSWKVPFLGKKWLEFPIIDAFGSPVKIQQNWLPELTQNYNFVQIARYDRCITCHQMIDRSKPGRPTDPLLDRGELYRFTLKVPSESELKKAKEAAKEEKGKGLIKAYGFDLSTAGFIKRNQVTVKYVMKESAAATAQAILSDGEAPDHCRCAKNSEVRASQ